MNRLSQRLWLGALLCGCTVACHQESSSHAEVEEVTELPQRLACFRRGDALAFRPRFRGVNAYSLLDLAGRGKLREVREVFARARALGRTLVRTNAFWEGSDRGGVTRTSPSAVREKGLVALDQVLAIAKEEGVNLILATSDNWKSYGGKPLIASWHSLKHPDAFFSDEGAIASQKKWLVTLATRVNTQNGVAYKNDCTIAAWELMNEARCDEAEFCKENTLTLWAKDMATTLTSSGVTQMISWGGTGCRKQHGEDFEALAAVKEIDVLTMHFYPDLSVFLLRDMTISEMRQEIRDELRKRLLPRIHIAKKSGKMLIIEEFGFSAEGLGDQKRAGIYQEVMSTAERYDVPLLPWMIAEPRRKDYDGYLIAPADRQLWQTLQDY